MFLNPTGSHMFFLLFGRTPPTSAKLWGAILGAAIAAGSTWAYSVNSHSQRDHGLHNVQQAKKSWSPRNFFLPSTTQTHCQASSVTEPLSHPPTARPSPNLWKIEEDNSFYYELIQHPDRAETHVILGHLLGPDLIEHYRVYKRIERDAKTATLKTPREVVLSHVTFGTRVDGHPGMVHGGILSLLLDDVMGYAFEALGVPHAVTANLNINYVNGVPAGASVVIRVRHARTDRRKLYFEAQMSSPDDDRDEDPVLYVEASGLFIIPRESYSEEEP